jgi:hypothetical protein
MFPLPRLYSLRRRPPNASHIKNSQKFFKQVILVHPAILITNIPRFTQVPKGAAQGGTEYTYGQLYKYLQRSPDEMQTRPTRTRSTAA